MKDCLGSSLRVQTDAGFVKGLDERFEVNLFRAPSRSSLNPWAGNVLSCLIKIGAVESC